MRAQNKCIKKYWIKNLGKFEQDEKSCTNLVQDFFKIDSTSSTNELTSVKSFNLDTNLLYGKSSKCLIAAIPTNEHLLNNLDLTPCARLVDTPSISSDKYLLDLYITKHWAHKYSDPYLDQLLETYLSNTHPDKHISNNLVVPMSRIKTRNCNAYLLELHAAKKFSLKYAYVEPEVDTLLEEYLSRKFPFKH